MFLHVFKSLLNCIKLYQWSFLCELRDWCDIDRWPFLLTHWPKSARPVVWKSKTQNVYIKYKSNNSIENWLLYQARSTLPTTNSFRMFQSRRPLQGGTQKWKLHLLERMVEFLKMCKVFLFSNEITQYLCMSLQVLSCQWLPNKKYALQWSEFGLWVTQPKNIYQAGDPHAGTKV